MSHRNVGRLFVAIQFALLITLLAVPRSDHWRTPWWVEVAGLLVVAGGLALVLMATNRLGNALTANPLPKDAAQLVTGGLYRAVRHPIYSGLLLAIVGVVLRSGNWVTAAVGGALFGFFHIKARWEEKRLRHQYPDYDRYAQHTPRFFPTHLFSTGQQGG